MFGSIVKPQEAVWVIVLHIGTPKQPTFSVYQLIKGKYQVQQFRGNDRIVSAAFPELNLTAEQVFTAGL